MLYQDFYSSFQGSVDSGDIKSANDALMKELGNILVKNRTDFVHLLAESGIPANSAMSDAKLVNLFIDNVGTNKNLTLGASLLVNMHNKQVSFDGENEVSDVGVKNGYAVMQQYFSNAIDPITAVAETIGKGVDLTSKGLEGRQKKKYGFQDALIAKNQAKDVMAQQVIAQREKEKTDKSKTNRTMLIVGGVVVGVAIIALVMYKMKQARK